MSTNNPHSLISILFDNAVISIIYMLDIYDILTLDTAYSNHGDRYKLLDVLSSPLFVIDDIDSDVSNINIDSALIWIGTRRINIVNLTITNDNNNSDDVNLITDVGLTGLSNHCSMLRLLFIKDGVKDIITDIGLMELVERCINLESFEFHGKSITDDSIVTLAKHCSHIQKLNIRYCDKISDTAIIEIVKRCTGLQKVNLFCCNKISDTAMINIAKYCTSLISLIVGGCDKITDTAMIEVARNCTSIEELDILRCVEITDKSLIQIANNCTNLHSLNIGSLKITDVSISAISQNCTALTHLRAMSCNLVTGSHIHHLPLLEDCNLGWCPGVTSDNVTSIVRNCKNLKKLCLCGTTQITDDCIIEIAHNSINLEYFNIHSCGNLTDENMCELVRCCINLQILDINNCHNITDEGLIKLAQQQQNLKSINIANSLFKSYRCWNIWTSF